MTNEKIIGPMLIILFLALVIGDGFYNQVSQTSAQRDSIQKIALAKAQYEKDTASLRPLCTATSTNPTGTLLYQCDLIYNYENDPDDPYALSGDEGNAPPSSYDLFNNPDLPSICKFPISQLTPLEISGCINPPPAYFH